MKKGLVIILILSFLLLFTISFIGKAISAIESHIVLVPADTRIGEGTSVNYVSILYMSDGSTSDVTSQTTFSSSNTTVATISGNVATSHNAGFTEIRGTYIGTKTHSGLSLLHVDKEHEINNPPVIISEPIIEVNENTIYSYQVTATDEDVLVFSLTQAPDWLSINSNTGLVSGIAPLVNVNTTFYVIIAVTGGVNSIVQRYVLTVKNIPESSKIVITSIPVAQINKSELYEYQVSATGGVGAYTFSLSIAPDFFSINPDTGLVSGTATEVGTYTIVIRVFDKAGNFATQSYSLTIYGAGEAPPLSEGGEISREETAQETPGILDAIIAPFASVVNFFAGLFGGEEENPYSAEPYSYVSEAPPLPSEDEIEERFVMWGSGSGPLFTNSQLNTNTYIANNQIVTVLDKKTNIFYTSDVFNTSEFTPDQIVQRLVAQISMKDSYIIEFKEPPVLESYKEELPPIFGAPLEPGAEQRIESQRERIHGLHERFADDVDSFSRTTGMGNLIKKLTGLITGKAADFESVKIINEYENSFSGASIVASPEQVEQIKELDYVKEVYPNTIAYTTLSESVPIIGAPDVWKLDADGNNCEESGKECLTGKNVTIAIIDTGVDYTHPDLGGCFGPDCKVVGGWDFVNQDSDPTDDMGHGTHVAATAAGKDLNGIYNGVAPDAKIVSYKVCDDRGGCWESDIIAAIEHAVDPNQDGNFSDKLDIISMSLGGSGNPDDPMSKAVDSVVDSGVVVVIAAGNSGPEERTIGSPGTARKAITVGATNKYNNIAYFSSRGPVIWEDEEGNLETIGLIKPDIVAPGVDICAAQWEDAFENYGYVRCTTEPDRIAISGTSMATPHVAGAAALLLQKHPDWTPEEIKMALRNTAVDIGENIVTQGYGRVDILEAIKSGTPLIAKINIEGENRGTLNIKVNGISTGDSYVLYYYQDDENNKNEICEGEGIKNNELICDWDVRNLKESTVENPYHLLLVSKQGNKKSEDRSIVFIINSELTSPKFDVFSTYNTLEISGTSAGYEFNKYEIELCEYFGFVEGKCTTEGVTLVNDGAFEIVKSILGEIDLANVKETGYYNIKLKTYRTNKQEAEIDTALIYIDTTLLRGFPRPIDIELMGGGGLLFAYSFMNQPVLADINKDGKKEIISTYLNKLYVIDSEGKDLEGFPVEIDWTQKGPAVDDLDGDGEKEIVVSSNYGGIFVYDSHGDLKNWFYVVQFIGTPTIDDLDNDGQKEIIVSKSYGFYETGSFVFVYDNLGNRLWKKYFGENVFNEGINEQSTGDVNGDGKKEIVFVTRSCPYGTCYSDHFTSNLYVVDYNGNILEGWPKKFKGYPLQPPILADVNNDGDIDIIFSDYSNLYVFDYLGNELFRINHNLTEAFYSVGDLNNDGIKEFVISGDTRGWGSKLHIYNTEGGVLGKSNTSIIGYITHGNLNQDSNKEISLGLWSGWGENGAAIYNYTADSIANKIMKDGILGMNVPLGDVNGDGKNEILAYGWDGKLYAWKSKGEETDSDWPQFQHDPQHTGCYNCTIEVERDTTPPLIFVEKFLSLLEFSPLSEELEQKVIVRCEDDVGCNTSRCEDDVGCNTSSYKHKISLSFIDSCPLNVSEYDEGANVSILLDSWVCGYGKDLAGNEAFSSPTYFKGQELTCTDGICMTLDYDCPNGCKDGKCIRQSAFARFRNFIRNIFRGRDEQTEKEPPERGPYYSKETCIDSEGNYIEDTCLDADTLREAYCGEAEEPPEIPQQICGNNVIEGSEICDGTDLNGQTCASQGYGDGELRCVGNCLAFDTEFCNPLPSGRDLEEEQREKEPYFE